MRIIGHVDMDAFFAAVEQRDNPRLRGKPVIIGGHKQSRRGVVSTCSYQARKFGVHSAMPIRQAVELCPQGIFLPGNMAKYRQISRQLYTILAEFTPLFEPVSIDEAYLDLSQCAQNYPSLWDLGLDLKKTIKQKLQLTASVGIASTKSAAKIASDLQKPDGLTVILPDEFDRVIGVLPVSKLHGVGTKTAQRLEKLGIKTILDIRKLGRKAMVATFGKHGDWIYNLSLGLDPRQVVREYTRKSIGRETTFDQDQRNPRILLQTLEELSSDIARRLQSQGLWGENVTLKLRTTDFVTTTRSLSVNRGIADQNEIWETARLLLEREWLNKKPEQRPALRLIGISVSNLTNIRQISLFTDL